MNAKNDIDIFIPSYHRPHNIKTAKYFISRGYDPKKIHVVVDDEADDIIEYDEERKAQGFNLHIFSMQEARERYDYVHRPSKSRRSAGQARNMFYDIEKRLEIDFYVVIDDDTTHFEIRPFGNYGRVANVDDIRVLFRAIRGLMEKRHVGIFGLSQNGEMFEKNDTKQLRNKVMNVSFINTKYIYRGERGVQDDDTSQFVTIYNEGYFTGSLRNGIVLHQTQSATQEGGLTDLYNECKLLNKALVCVIQFPSAIIAEKQIMNGGRLHHRIKARYLVPKLLKGERSNIEWDAYPEDAIFTNEPKR